MKKVLSILITVLFGMLLGVILSDPYTKGLIDDNKNVNRMNDSLSSIAFKYDSLVVYTKTRKWKEFIVYKESGINLPSTLKDSVFEFMESQKNLYNIPDHIFWRLIYKESSFRMVENKKSGAFGYMQVMPATFNHYKDRALATYNQKDYKNNIRVGTYILREHHDRFTNKGFNDKRAWELALSAYNAGLGNVIKYKYNIPRFKETIDYVAFILKKYNSPADI